MERLSEEQARLIGGLIKKQISLLGHSNVTVAEMASVDERSVRDAKRGLVTIGVAQKLCSALKIDLQSTLDDLTASKRGQVNSPEEMGGYSRNVFSDYIGSYITVRPAYGKANLIKCFETYIDWDDKLNCLAFEEDRSDDNGHSGTVFVPPMGSYMFLTTIEKGFVRTIQVSRLDPSAKFPMMQGLIMSQYRVSGQHFVPICAPIAYIKGSFSEVHNEVDDDELSPLAPSYGRFASILHNTFRENFALMQVLEESRDAPIAAPFADEETG